MPFLNPVQELGDGNMKWAWLGGLADYKWQEEGRGQKGRIFPSIIRRILRTRSKTLVSLSRVCGNQLGWARKSPAGKEYKVYYPPSCTWLNSISNFFHKSISLDSSLDSSISDNGEHIWQFFWSHFSLSVFHPTVILTNSSIKHYVANIPKYSANSFARFVELGFIWMQWHLPTQLFRFLEFWSFHPVQDVYGFNQHLETYISSSWQMLPNHAIGSSS